MDSFYALHIKNVQKFQTQHLEYKKLAHKHTNSKEACMYFSALKCEPVIERSDKKLNLYCHFRLAIQYPNLVTEMAH